MKFIQKRPEPRELLNWKAQNANTPQNLYYGGGGFPAEAVRQSLLDEQFHLCAYTMKRLKTSATCIASGFDTGSSCHVEHVLPQSRNGAPTGEDIDYQNIVACYPPSQSNVACDYGAVYKADFDPTEAASDPTKLAFVSPLSNNPERHFSFNARGDITGLTPEGKDTIGVLNLGHSALVSDRAAAINGALKPRRGQPISAAAARRLAQEVMRADGQRCLPAYCVAVACAALAHAEKEERKAARLRQRGNR